MSKTVATLELPCPAPAEHLVAFLPPDSAPKQQISSADLDSECFHCGTACAGRGYLKEGKAFCCGGCLTVFELLTENGLTAFYQFGERAAGIRGGGPTQRGQFKFVDQPSVRERLVDFSNQQITRVRFRLPAIHCIACVWLLENLFRLKQGIGQSRVNFPRKEIAISFETRAIELSEVIGLLSSLGYEPDLKLSDLGARPLNARPKRLWVQLGIAGFAFGNTMLFSLASYLGLDSVSQPGFQKLVGVLSLLLALPVMIYSAADYWKSAALSLRQRLLNIDVPIAAGILALFAQSAYAVLSGGGVGYFDSLAGLLFFLLCGKLFQEKTFDRLAFDRDYRSFFPLAVRRQTENGEETISVSALRLGDVLHVCQGELIPADARLLQGRGLIDYSFVTGESEPISKGPGDHVYAGGRQIGGAIEVQTVKAVSQGYLTSLWNQDAFRKPKDRDSLNTLTNRYSQRFTRVVLGIALGSALVWAVVDPKLSLKAFTSVVIVACPCALALAAPFALGTAQRVLSRRQVFLKNPSVLEALAAADSIVFDKTGTLTTGTGEGSFHGPALSLGERHWIRSLARHSTHPAAIRLSLALASNASPLAVEAFEEVAGRGIEGWVEAKQVLLGSADWLLSKGVRLTFLEPATGSTVHVAFGGKHRGWFDLSNQVRPETPELLAALSGQYHLALLSGDNDHEEDRFRRLLGPAAQLHFNQTPLGKLAFIRRWQNSGRAVIMVGDGLNDAGALRQSNVGIAVVEHASTFSPASDIIMAGRMVPRLSAIARFARLSVRVVRGSFLISTLYNLVGITIAARGLLEPIVCAVLMPLSSVTVVAFACLTTHWLGRRILPDTGSAEPV